MALDFPASPTTGQKYPTTPVVGVPTYTWDGEKWTTKADAIAGDIYVKKAGDTMSGPLVLSADPTAVMHSTTKQYTDAGDANAADGIQYNGGMEVSQLNGATVVGVANQSAPYIVDGFKIGYGNAGAVVTGAQIAAAAFPSAMPGYPNALQMTATTAFSALANGDWSGIFHTIEGTRISKLGWGTANAQPITVTARIWVTVSGVAILKISNAANTRFYYSELTLAAGWNFVSVTIPGDTTGAWVTDNTRSIEMAFTFAGKDAVPVQAGLWLGAPSVTQTLNSTNFFATSGNKVIITGVAILPGAVTLNATQAQLLMRPYANELILSQRYYETHAMIMRDNGVVSTIYNWCPFVVTKRAVPSIALTNVSYGGSSSSLAPANTTINGTEVYFGTSAPGSYVFFVVTASSRL